MIEHQEALQPNQVTTITMRPHHFFMDDVRSAIRGRVSPRILALGLNLALFIGRPFQRNKPGYYEDITGKTLTQIWRRQEGFSRYFTQLRSLAADDLIKFDLEPDGICNSCPVGKHCTATNFRVGTKYDDIQNTAEEEERDLMRIDRKLQEADYRLGRDFWYGRTNTTLYNFNREPLSFPVRPLPQNASFNALYVKVGALRGII